MNIGIIGLGTNSSVGFGIAKRISQEFDVDRLMINDRDDVERQNKVETFARHILMDQRAGYGTLDEMASECDITLLCAENSYGGAKGDIPLRSDLRRELFDGNIDMVLDIREKFRRYEGKFIVVSNPTDLLAYYFSRRAGGQVMGFNHVDTFRFENEMRFYLSRFEERPIDKVVAEIWGEHGPNSMIVPSQIRVFCGEEKRVIDYPEIVDRLEEKKKEMDGLAFKVIKNFATTTQETVDALMHVLKCIVDGRGRFIASMPYSFRGEDVYLGQPCQVHGKEIKVVENDVHGLHPRKVIADGHEKSERDRWSEIVARNYDTLKSIERNGRRYVGGEPDPDVWSGSYEHFYKDKSTRKRTGRWKKYGRIGRLLLTGALIFATAYGATYLYKNSRALSSENNVSYLSRNTSTSHQSP